MDRLLFFLEGTSQQSPHDMINSLTLSTNQLFYNWTLHIHWEPSFVQNRSFVHGSLRNSYTGSQNQVNLFGLYKSEKNSLDTEFKITVLQKNYSTCYQYQYLTTNLTMTEWLGESLNGWNSVSGRSKKLISDWVSSDWQRNWVTALFVDYIYFDEVEIS